MDISGAVEKVTCKQLEKGRDAGKMSFAVKLVGDERYFGCYTNDPKVVSGQQVSFQASQNSGGYWNVDMKTLKKGEVSSNGNGNSSGNNGAVGSVAPQYMTKRNDQAVQQAIRRQASRNSAIAALDLAVKAGVKIPLPTKPAEQLDALLSLVDEITVRYEKDTEEAMEPSGE